MRQYATARSVHADPFETGDLTREYGLVTGRVVQFADALDCAPSDVLGAVEGAVTPLVDTAEQNPDTRTEQERPTDPEKRCLAFSEEDFRRVAAEIGAREALEGESVPSESR
jgi:hypothetical protein